jgi:oligoendopeptidase F
MNGTLRKIIPAIRHKSLRFLIKFTVKTGIIMGSTAEVIKRKKRHYLNEEFKIGTWEGIEGFYIELKNREIFSKEALIKWFKDRSELESVLSEDLGWRYIRMTGDTSNQKYADEFNFFLTDIQPQIAPFSHDLDEKALRSPFFKEIKETGFDIILRLLEKDHKIFRQENISLLTEIEQAAHTFGNIAGVMSVEIDGKELTLQQAADYLQSGDRKERETAYLKIAERRYQDKDKLDNLYSKLVGLRHQVAQNADFINFRDYMFVSLGRFDYTIEDTFNFHYAIEKEVVPILDELARERKTALQVNELRPWDLSVNYLGKTPLKPFENENDLLDKAIKCFHEINPYLGACLTTMKNMGHLDLVSRKGKAPGGYNYPLDEIGVPFIFMNATSTLKDLVTLVHEGGHALHSFVTKDLPLNTFKHPTSEVAELASMSMELISMEHWDIFFPDPKDLVRAKKEHLEGIIQTLPWVAIIDKFQHWVYEHPHHTSEERKETWCTLFSAFSNKVTDWKGLEQYRNYGWQKQLHLYEVPFYYIEYAIAQLGAIAIWKNYKKDHEKGFNNYLAALKLGYTRPIREIYKAGGIQFDFSQPYIKELMDFVKKEMDNL